MQWAIVGFGKLEKTRFGVTLLEQEAWGPFGLNLLLLKLKTEN